MATIIIALIVLDQRRSTDLWMRRREGIPPRPNTADECHLDSSVALLCPALRTPSSPRGYLAPSNHLLSVTAILVSSSKFFPCPQVAWQIKARFRGDAYR